MKTISITVIRTIALSFAFALNAQQNFENLNFEAATLSTPITGPITGAEYQPITLVLPDWTATLGTIQQTEVLENDLTSGSASLDIFTSTMQYPGVIDGSYSIVLQAGANPQGGTSLVDASLWQDGTIPANAMSLQFKVWSVYPTANFTVSFAGNSLSPVGLSSGQTPSGETYELYGANIATFAGQTGQLDFTALANNGVNLGNIELDDITFSPTAVTPEPGTLALVVMGGAAMLVRRWRGRRS